jgi:hypothetical protein
MIKGAGKVIGNAARMRKSSARDMLLATGLVALIAGVLIRHYMMKAFGFETDSFGLRYYKPTIDEDGNEKEVVVYLATPDNIWLRYYNRWKSFPDSPDKLKAFIDKTKWDLHPVWLLGINLLANKKADGNPIYNPFDDPNQISENIFKFVLKNTVRIFDAIPESDSTNLEGYKALQKDLGNITAILLHSTALSYLREGKERREYFRMKSLIDTYNSFMFSDEPETDEEAEKRMEQFEEKLRKIEEEFEKEDKKEPPKRTAPTGIDNTKRMIDY